MGAKAPLGVIQPFIRKLKLWAIDMGFLKRVVSFRYPFAEPVLNGVNGLRAGSVRNL